jgi:hypothetical protein
MNINIDGHRIRVVEYGEPLFRADDANSHHNSGNQHYGAMYNKFFTTQKNETKSYANRLGKSYTKTWIPSEPLRLIDILHTGTRLELEKLLARNATLLNTAFPVVKNRVYRYSEDETAGIDAELLRAICSLRGNDGKPAFDGFYMKRQTNTTISNNGRSILPFHSEIGLCNSALRKIKLNRGATNITSAPPKIVKNNTRGRRRRTNNNNGNQRNYTMSRRRMFNNSNNNSNNANMPSISRKSMMFNDSG